MGRWNFTWDVCWIVCPGDLLPSQSFQFSVFCPQWKTALPLSNFFFFSPWSSETIFFFLLCVMGLKKWANHHSYLLKNGHHFSCGLPAHFPALLFHAASFAWSLKLNRSSLLWLSHLQKFLWYPYKLATPPKNPVRKGTSISPLAVSAFSSATAHLCVIDKLL